MLFQARGGVEVGGGGVEDAVGVGIEHHGKVDDPSVGLGRGRKRGPERAGREGGSGDLDEAVAVSDLVEAFSAQRTGVLGLRGREHTFDHLLMQRMQNW